VIVSDLLVAIENYIHAFDWVAKLIGYAISLGILAALFELIKWFREIHAQRRHDNEARVREEDKKALESYKALEDGYLRF
jgi:hypothetical protein